MESAIAFCNEQWTAESARLLLELDEGWVGFHGATQWRWHDATYDLFAVECQQRHWACNSRQSSVAMMHALRSGQINMKISSAGRSSQGFVQWSPVEMRTLGWQMWRLSTGFSPLEGWPKLMSEFVQVMRNKDRMYAFAVEGRSIEEFKSRAGKYLSQAFVREIEAVEGRDVSIQSLLNTPTGVQSGESSFPVTNWQEAITTVEWKNDEQKEAAKQEDVAADMGDIAVVQIPEDQSKSDDIVHSGSQSDTSSEASVSIKKPREDATPSEPLAIAVNEVAQDVEVGQDLDGEAEWTPEKAEEADRATCGQTQIQDPNEHAEELQQTGSQDLADEEAVKPKRRKPRRLRNDDPLDDHTHKSIIELGDDKWTAESARLLLELDEGWVGFHNAKQWQWNDATYDLFAVECQEREWSCHSRESCMAMMHALRSGTISMKISNDGKSSQGFVQWSPIEMRTLGWLMYNVATGIHPIEGWGRQLEVFTEAMLAKDPKYFFGVVGRSEVDFKKRASRFLGEKLTKKIDICDEDGSATSSEPSSADEKPQRAKTRTNLSKKYNLRREKRVAIKKYSPVKTLRRRRLLRGNTTTTISSKNEAVTRPEEAVADSNQTLVAAEGANVAVPPPETVVAQGNTDGYVAVTSLKSPEDIKSSHTRQPKRRRRKKAIKYNTDSSSGSDEEWTPEEDFGAEILDDDDYEVRTFEPTAIYSTHHPETRKRAAKRAHNPAASPHKANKRQRLDQLDVHKHKRQQVQPTSIGKPKQATSPQAFNKNFLPSGKKAKGSSLAPTMLDPTAKPWSAFVDELLIAEKNARHEDELDYVQFIRQLYDV